MNTPQRPRRETRTAGTRGDPAPLYDETVVRVLRTTRRAVRPRLSQDAAAGKMGLVGAQRRNAIWDWESGRDRPAAERRWAFAVYLWDTLELRRHPWRFVVIWDFVAVRQWTWPPLDEPFLDRAFGGDIPPSLRAWCGREAPAPVLAPPTLERVPSTPDFIGREGERASYSRQLKDRGIALIIGMAGVGKTTLAAVLAWSRAQEGKAFWHRFVPGDDINTVLWQLAGFLHHHGQPEVWRRVQTAVAVGGPRSVVESCLETCLQALEGRDYLLCFDDFQWVADDPQIDNLILRLADSPVRRKLKVIVAGRRGPRALEILETQPLAGLVKKDAQRLLEDRLPGLNQNYAVRLHEQLEGNPALLTLAINALRAAGSQQALLEQLDRAQFVHDFLLHQVDADLTGELRGVMDALALLGGRATLPELEAVAGGPHVREVLNELHDRLLLRRSDDQLHGQFTQHDIVRDFYRERPGREARLRMHARAGEYFERVERNQLAAAEHHLAGEQYERCAQLLTRDIWQPIYAGQMGLLSELLKRLRPDDLAPPLWAAVNLALGQVQAFRREVASARLCFETAYVAACGLEPGRETALLKARASRGLAELLRSTEPEEAVGWAQRGLAELAPYEADAAPPAPLKMVQAPGAEVARESADLRIQAGFAKINAADFDGAIELLSGGLARLPLGPDPLRTAALINLGVAYCTQGDARQGMDYYEQALKLAEQTGDLWRVVSIRHNMGIEQELAGRWDLAAAEYAAALAQAERIGSRTPQTGVTLALGILNMKQGNLESAEGCLRKAVGMARQYDLGRHLAASLSSLADLLLRKGQPAAAIPLLAEAQALAKKMDAGDQLAEIERNRAVAHLALGETAAALSAVERSLDWARKLALESEEGLTLRVRGEALAATGQRQAADGAFVESLKRLAGSDPYENARVRLAWGRCLLARPADPHGLQLVSEARAEFARLGAAAERQAADVLLAASAGAIQVNP